MSRSRSIQWACAALAPLLACAAAVAQYADLDRADWKEDTVPPPPAYSSSGLIEIDMPRNASVKMGVDPKTIAINTETGIVRYVAVAQGPSAVNASYEGIRCATGEYRVYARQVQGGEWAPGGDTNWKPMMGQSNIMVRHPLQLARGGMCVGTAMPSSVREIVRALQTGSRNLYH